jgi:HEAT repeat protein
MIRKSDGGIDRTRMIDLNQNFRVHDREVYWLGTPDSNESVALLAALAGSAAPNAVSALLHAMTLHDGGSATQHLLDLVRSSSNSLELRKNAMFWLGQEVSRQANAGLTGMLSDPNTEIQKQAVFAISRRNNDESIPALIDVAKKHPNPAVRREAIVWLAQKRDERVLAFFEQLLKK